MTVKHPTSLLWTPLLLFAACAPAANDSGNSGDDASGSTGGDDAYAAGDSLVPAGDYGPVVCPPPGPYGNGLGDTLENITLSDCDGNSHDLFDLCEAPAAWLFLYAGW